MLSGARLDDRLLDAGLKPFADGVGKLIFAWGETAAKSLKLMFQRILLFSSRESLKG